VVSSWSAANEGLLDGHVLRVGPSRADPLAMVPPSRWLPRGTPFRWRMTGPRDGAGLPDPSGEGRVGDPFPLVTGKSAFEAVEIRFAGLPVIRASLDRDDERDEIRERERELWVRFYRDHKAAGLLSKDDHQKMKVEFEEKIDRIRKGTRWRGPVRILSAVLRPAILLNPESSPARARVRRGAATLWTSPLLEPGDRATFALPSWWFGNRDHDLRRVRPDARLRDDEIAITWE